MSLRLYLFTEGSQVKPSKPQAIIFIFTCSAIRSCCCSVFNPFLSTIFPFHTHTRARALIHQSSSLVRSSLRSECNTLKGGWRGEGNHNVKWVSVWWQTDNPTRRDTTPLYTSKWSPVRNYPKIARTVSRPSLTGDKPQQHYSQLTPHILYLPLTICWHYTMPTDSLVIMTFHRDWPCSIIGSTVKEIINEFSY